MAIAKTSTNFSPNNFSDLGLAIKGAYIIGKMTDNPHFSSPIPSLVDVQAVLDEYNAAFTAAAIGTKVDRVIKNNKRVELQARLRDLGLYVQLISGGDEVLISSSGFNTTKKRSVIGTLDKPKSIKIVVGPGRGQVTVSCVPIDRAAFYVLEYAEVTADGTFNWKSITSTKRKIGIEGLTSGKEYAFRLAGAATDPSRIWSNIIKTFVI